MVRYIVSFVFCALAFAANPSAPRSSEPGLLVQMVVPGKDQVQILTTKDGSVRIGRILERTDSGLRFGTDNDESLIPYDKVQSVRTVAQSSMRNGEYWAPNPNGTRLFFSPTGRMLKQGEGYFADHLIFFPAAAVGLTDNITIGAGMSIFPGVDFGNQLFFITPKIGGSISEKLHLAVGALMLRWDVDDDGGTGGIVYGVGTYGTPESSVTIGLGYGYAGSDIAEKPVVMVGGERRLSRRIAFVTENWFVPGEGDPLVTYGIRFLGEKLTVDFALVNTFGDDFFFPGVPYIDFVVGF
jgi:hypothetical protein